jgi:hypothetical protein
LRQNGAQTGRGDGDRRCLPGVRRRKPTTFRYT